MARPKTYTDKQLEQFDVATWECPDLKIGLRAYEFYCKHKLNKDKGKFKYCLINYCPRWDGKELK